MASNKLYRPVRPTSEFILSCIQTIKLCTTTSADSLPTDWVTTCACQNTGSVCVGQLCEITARSQHPDNHSLWLLSGCDWARSTPCGQHYSCAHGLSPVERSAHRPMLNCMDKLLPITFRHRFQSYKITSFEFVFYFSTTFVFYIHKESLSEYVFSLINARAHHLYGNSLCHYLPYAVQS